MRIAAPLGPLRVAIASRDRLVRSGVLRLIEPDLGSGQVVDADADADVIVWDVGAWDVPVLAVLPEPSLVSVAVAAGVAGAILRDRLNGGLVAALDAIRYGFAVFDSDLVESLQNQGEAAARGTADIADDGESLDFEDSSVPMRIGRTERGARAIESLTAREHGVVQLLAEGLSNRAIAATLAISEHTVKFHVNSILTKLDARTRTEAVVEAVRRGLVLL